MTESISLIELISLLVGTSGLTGFIVSIVTLRYSKSKAKSEAKEAEAGAQSAQAEADMKRQDYYQEIIDDMEKDRQRMKVIRDEQEAYVAELREDRRRLREEKEQLRQEKKDLAELIENQDKKIAKQDEKIRKQGDKILYLERMVDSLKPLICANVGCTIRQTDILGLVSDDSFEPGQAATESDKPNHS